jgi:hypothetical protein
VQKIFTLIAMLLAITPVFSQPEKTATTSECEARLKGADTNKDGVLTRTELTNTRQIPPALAKNAS